MTTIVTRAGKGSPLTNNEMDTNLNNLNTATGTDIQVQLVTAFTTGGSSTAYTLTPSPASAGNAANQRYRVKFNAAAGATPTLAVSGQAAAGLRYANATGTKVAITAIQVPNGWIADVEFDGTYWMVLQIATDANVAKLDTYQTWTGAQRGTLTTDNDGSFDQDGTNNFFCTPTGAVTLTFTHHTAGQSGLVLFVNTANYAITAAATTYIAAADLTKLSATGTYLISYLDNGTNAYCVVSAKLTSAGA